MGAHQGCGRPAWLGVWGWGMLGGVSGRRIGRVEVGATGVALTALVGEWFGHTVEFLRVSGWRGAFGSIHVLAGPIGVVLIVAALAAVHSTMRVARLLERRLAELRHIEGRGLPAVPWRASPPTRRLWSVPALVAMVWATGCGLYVLQENLEAGVAHRGVPGFSVLAGVHAVAPLIHLAIALAVVAGLWVSRRQVTRLAQVVRLAEVRLRLVRRAAPIVRTAAGSRAWTPIDRWGSQLWSRPPPASRVV